MKKLSSIFMLFVALVLSLTLFACNNDQNSQKAPVAESISVSGQKTQFYVGDEFSAEGLTVTVTYDDKTDKIAESSEYTVDGSAYVASVAGNYMVIVKLNGTTLETSYSVFVEEKGYEVKADRGITFNSGVVNGKTKAESVISFTATPSSGKHITAVKVNDTTLTAQDGVYTFSASEFIENDNSVINITLEQTAHSYEKVVTAAKCQEGGYTTFTCECGYSYKGATTEARFLFTNLDDWTSGVKLELADNAAKYTMTTDDGWSVAYRQINLKTTDYIRFTATGKFKVELRAKGEAVGTVIIAEQQMNNKSFTVPVESVVTEDGEYTLLVYVVGARDSIHTVTECFALSSGTEDVHKWTTSEDEKTRECDICHIKENIGNEDANEGFLYLSGDWTSGVKLEVIDNTAKYTMTTDDGWSVSYRQINLKTTDYIRFTGTGKFKVEIRAKGSDIGTVIIAEQDMDNKSFVVPVNSAVTEDGEYTLLVYVVGARDSVHTVTECCITASAENTNA